MERVKIDEAKARYFSETGKKLTDAKIAEVVFKGEGLSKERMRTLINRVNNGRENGRLEPRHYLRLCRFLKITKVEELFSE